MKLVRFLRKCRNEKVRVETKEKLLVEGTVVSVDKTMNIELQNATVDGSPVGAYTIRGSSVRYVLFRDDIDFKPLLVDDRPDERVKRRKTRV